MGGSRYLWLLCHCLNSNLYPVTRMFPLSSLHFDKNLIAHLFRNRLWQPLLSSPSFVLSSPDPFPQFYFFIFTTALGRKYTPPVAVLTFIYTFYYYYYYVVDRDLYHWHMSAITSCKRSLLNWSSFEINYLVLVMCLPVMDFVSNPTRPTLTRYWMYWTTEVLKESITLTDK